MPVFGFGNLGISNLLRQQQEEQRQGFTSDGPIETPGEEIELRGLNDFLRSSGQLGQATDSLFSTVNRAGSEAAAGRARDRADRSFDVAEGAVERRQRGLGLRLTERQQRAQSRRLSLGREIAKADAATGTRRAFSDRSRSAATAGLGLADTLRGIETGGLVDLSNAAGQELIRQEERRAQKKQNKNSIIGSLVGLGAALLSSEKVKHDKRPVTRDGKLLDKLKNVRVERWKYIGDDTDHVGPYAEEFNETFGVGEANKRMIHLGDAVGVLMGSIKELNEKVEARG